MTIAKITDKHRDILTLCQKLTKRHRQSPARIWPPVQEFFVTAQYSVVNRVLFAIAITSFALSSGCNSSETSEGSKPPHVALVKTLEIKKSATNQVHRQFTGTIKGRRESRLGFNLAGRIESILVSEGQQIKTGQVIAQLNTDSLNARLKQTEAEIKVAAALLAELQAGPRQQEIKAARANLLQAESDFRLAEIRNQRHKNLGSTGAISEQESDNSHYLAQAAKGRLDAARENLNLLLAGTRKEKIAAQKARISQLKAALESIDVQIKESQILAPYSGIIANRSADEGEIISPANPVVSIIETGALEAWIGVPEKVIPSLKIGSTYSLQSVSQSFQAKLKAILPSLNPATRTQTVIFEIPKKLNPHLSSGSVARLSITQDVNQEGYWLPTSALTRGEKGLWSAMGVLPAGGDKVRFKTVRLDVEVLLVDSDRVLVRGTLKDGMRIVETGIHKLTSNQIVRVEGGKE